jgi:hypothetical protein
MQRIVQGAAPARVVVTLLLAVTACDSRLHVVVHRVEPAGSAVPKDAFVCSPVPPLPEQNKAYTDYIALALARRLYCDAANDCDALKPQLPADLYGKQMKLICPRARLCSAGDDVRYDTPDDACQNVIVQEKQFKQFAIPARATRFISLELPLCEGTEEPLATVATFLRGSAKRVSIITLDCPSDTRCEFSTLRGGDVGHGTVSLAEHEWSVTAYELPNEAGEDRLSNCPVPTH